MNKATFLSSILATLMVVQSIGLASAVGGELNTTPAELITLAGLRENIDFVFPDEAYLSGLEFHSTWAEVDRRSMLEAAGVEVTYHARFNEAPNFEDELPTINAYILPKASKADAEFQFNALKNSIKFSNGTWDKLSEGDDFFAYMSGSTSQSDIIKYRSLEESSLHWVSQFDNALIVVNFYRPGGEYIKRNVNAFRGYLSNHEDTLDILNELVIFSKESIRFFLGGAYSVEGPSDDDYHVDLAAYSFNLSEKSDESPYPGMMFARNGTIQWDLYIDDASEVGTVIDMVGDDTPIPGSIQVELNEKGEIQARLFDDRVQSRCRNDQGWHQITSTPISLYDWQTVTVGYGWMEGFKLNVGDDFIGTCEVNTPRAEGPIYLGDYPGDNLAQSFVGYIKNVTTEFSENEGQILDDLQGNLIFADVSEAHPNSEAIEYMRDNGIIEGYDNGTFRPYQAVNRVEILKMLLLGFGYDVPGNTDTPDFSDVPRNEWYLPYLNYALQFKIVQGDPDGRYRPADSVNRVEFLKILLVAYGINAADYPVTELYPDTELDQWYAPYVQFSKDNGLMDLDENGNFNPGAQVSRAEVAETIHRLVTSN